MNLGAKKKVVGCFTFVLQGFMGGSFQFGWCHLGMSELMLAIASLTLHYWTSH